MKKKFETMTDEQRRNYVRKNMDKSWKTYEHWRALSQKLNTGTWTKADIDLIDTLLVKEESAG